MVLPQSRRAKRGGARTLVRSNSRTPRRAKNLYSPHSLFTLLRTKVRARALGSERAPEGESPSLAVLPARQLKVTASRQRDVESNLK